MLERISRIVAASALISGSLLGTVNAAETINFGIISTETSQNLRVIWEPLLEDMSRKTGFEVKAFFAPDYAGIIQGMRFNKVDVAWYGNKSAIEAVDRAGGEVFASTEAADGSAGYYSHLVVHRDSPISNVEDMLKNAGSLTFANGDPNSTSGYLVPGYYVFAQNKVNPQEIFKRTLTGSHEINALSIANRQVDVGTLNSESLKRLTVTAPDKAELLKVIWTSPLIPSDPLVWRKNLPQSTRDTLREFFASYGSTPEEMNILAQLDWARFRVADNDHLLPIRQLELFKERTELTNNQSMAPADRQKRLQQLDEELAQLEKRMNRLATNN